MIGTEIANYRILEKLGEGGMGVVYKAIDTSLDRPVALKALNAEYSRNPELLERFRAEAKMQANLSHSNIATLYSFVVQDGQGWMVMEYVEGETVAHMIERRGLLPIQDVIPLFTQALQGIGYAHRIGIIHRDIKPSNLIVNRSGILKVMDFGIAKVVGSRGLTRTGTQMGTAYYMSPEQVLNKPVDIRSDIYSLGVTLYEMLTANVPFQGDSDFQILSDHVYTPPQPPSRVHPYIPKSVENAVLKALEKNPDARFQTVEEFATALEHPTQGDVRKRTPVPAPGQSPKQTPRIPLLPALLGKRWREILAGGIGLLGLALCIWAFFPHKTQPVVNPRPVEPAPVTRSEPSVVPTPLPPEPSPSPQEPTPAKQGLKILSFSSDLTRVTPGQRIRLSWSVRGASEVSITPIGKVNPDGSLPLIIRETTQFTLLAKAPNGQTTQRVTNVEVVGVKPPEPSKPPSIVSFQAEPNTIRIGQSATLRWSVSGNSAVMITGIGEVQPEGSGPVSPTQTTTYTLTARNANGTDSKEVTIRVERQVKPEISFAVVPQTIQRGGSATLRWSILNAESASIDPQPGVLQQASGQHTVTPATSTTYTLTARSQDGTVARAIATLQVTAPAVRTGQAIQVIHDHGGSLSDGRLPSCHGVLQVVGDQLRYTVVGATDGRDDNFQLPLNQIQEVKTNRLAIRGQRAFHVRMSNHNFNFIPTSTATAQAVLEIESGMRAR